MKENNSRFNFFFFIFSSAIFIIFSAAWAFHNSKELWSATYFSLLPPLALYFSAHIMRVIRLWVLMGAGRARRLMLMYLYTTACSALIPFKLGELVRINEIANWKKSYSRGLLIVWIERAFDVGAMGLIAAFMLTTNIANHEDIGVLLWVIGIFISLTTIGNLELPAMLAAR